LTSFVGRAGQVGEVASLLNEYRLVTVTGAGGGGKTPLGREGGPGGGGRGGQDPAGRRGGPAGGGPVRRRGMAGGTGRGARTRAGAGGGGGSARAAPAAWPVDRAVAGDRAGPATAS